MVGCVVGRRTLEATDVLGAIVQRSRALFLVSSLTCAAQPAAPLAPNEDAAFNGWLRAVQARIITSALRAHGYPRSARVTVALFVHHDGSVSDVHAISASDPDPHYWRLAERIVGLAGPHPPMPDSYRHERVSVVIPLRFDARPPARHRKRR